MKNSFGKKIIAGCRQTKIIQSTVDVVDRLRNVHTDIPSRSLHSFSVTCYCISLPTFGASLKKKLHTLTGCSQKNYNACDEYSFQYGKNLRFVYLNENHRSSLYDAGRPSKAHSLYLLLVYLVQPKFELAKVKLSLVELKLNLAEL